MSLDMTDRSFNFYMFGRYAVVTDSQNFDFDQQVMETVKKYVIKYKLTQLDTNALVTAFTVVLPSNIHPDSLLKNGGMDDNVDITDAIVTTRRVRLHTWPEWAGSPKSYNSPAKVYVSEEFHSANNLLNYWHNYSVYNNYSHNYKPIVILKSDPNFYVFEHILSLAADIPWTKDT